MENQGELIFEIRQLRSQVTRLENRLREFEEKLVDKYDTTNEKAFIEVNFYFFKLI